MHTQLVSWARLAFLAGLALCLVLVIPVPSFPFQLLKVAVFSLALAVCAILFVAGGGARELLRAHGLRLALLVALLPLSYALAWALSTDKAVGLMGYGLETDTLLFVALAAGAFLFAFALFRTLRTVRMLLSVLFWALAAAAVFQLVSVLFGHSLIPTESFADRSSNLVGKWNDLGLLAALLALMLFARVELSKQDALWRSVAAIGGALLLLLLGLVNFAPAWGLFLAGSIAVGVLALLRRRGTSKSFSLSSVPWYAAAGSVAAIAFLLYGSALNTSLTSVFPVSSLEVRPSLTSTLDLANTERTGSVGRGVWGTGPGTFGERWLISKPAEVNQTPFWNLDFNVGYSTVSTALVSTGLLGALAWLLPLALMLAAMLRAVRLDALAREERIAALTLGVASLFLYASLIVYVPSQNLILLAFALAGATFGFLWRQGRSAAEGEDDDSVSSRAMIAASVVLVVLVLLGSGLTARRFVSQIYTGAGLYALAQGDSAGAIASADRALGVEQSPDALRLRSAAGARHLASLSQDNSLPVAEARDAFSAEAERTISAAQALVALTPQDYRAYFGLGQIYQLFATLKVEGAYSAAVAAYTSAAERNPMSPTIPLELARLEYSVGDADATEQQLTRALELKPDYTDAILFLVELNVGRGDLPSAVKNAEAAVRSAPGVASIWFELGVLYRAQGEIERSGQALEQALQLEPNYANAKYYLALAYADLGGTQEALVIFEELAAQNPDNETLARVISNLREGRKALEGISSQGGAPIQE